MHRSKVILLFHRPATEEAREKKFYRRASSSRIHQLLDANLNHVLNVTRSISDVDTIVVDPHPEYLSHHGSLKVIKQEGRGLADAMVNAAHQAKDMGYDDIFFLGADLPNLKSENILSAMAALDQADSVIGPSPDGGFFILGVRSHALHSLINIIPSLSLCTSRALSQLRHGLETAGVSYLQIEALSDLDSWSDIKALRSTMGLHLDQMIEVALSQLFHRCVHAWKAMYQTSCLKLNQIPFQARPAPPPVVC